MICRSRTHQFKLVANTGRLKPTRHQRWANTGRHNFVVRIHTAKRPDTRERRIRESIALLAPDTPCRAKPGDRRAIAPVLWAAACQGLAAGRKLGLKERARPRCNAPTANRRCDDEAQ